MRIPEAVAALWQALSEGHLVAVGFDAQDVVVEIPSREWVYLRLREEGERDVLSYDAVGQPAFTAVTLRQSDVLRLWPVTGESTGIANKAHRRRSQVGLVKQALSIEFPDGVPPNLTDKEIRRRIGPIFEKNSWNLPSRDTIARALGRRKVG